MAVVEDEKITPRTADPPRNTSDLDIGNMYGPQKMRFVASAFQKSQSSPVYTAMQVITSPARYINRKIRPGGIKGSIFNLIWGVLGTGMLTLPAICQLNGIAFGSILIAIGGLITIFWGMCIVTCSEKTGSDSLEFIAHIAFGESISRLTSFCMIMCLLGYVTSYIVIVKSIVPYILRRIFDQNLPDILLDANSAQFCIATLYCVIFLLPLSLPRTLGALRFSSLFGFVCCLILLVVITLIFIFSRVVVPDPIANIEEATYFEFTFSGVLSTFPLIISSYMYQPMIPAIYKNLERRNFKRMEKVVMRGSYGAVFLYIIIAVFGYLTFVGDEKELEVLRQKQNILECNYHQNFYFEVSILLFIFTIMAAGPLCVVPWKDTCEDLLFPETIMTDLENVLMTLILVSICYVCAIFIPSIGGVLTVLGLTWNPFIGFFLPVLWFLKLDPDWSFIMKAFSLLILGTTLFVSILGIYDYVGTIFF